MSWYSNRRFKLYVYDSNLWDKLKTDGIELFIRKLAEGKNGLNLTELIKKGLLHENWGNATQSYNEYFESGILYRGVRLSNLKQFLKNGNDMDIKKIKVE